jgi:hypothetical protein
MGAARIVLCVRATKSIRIRLFLLVLATVAGAKSAAADPAAALEDTPMNSLMVISPYKHQGMWVFDDPAVGLNKEPFIAGIDTMIDKLVAEIPNAQQGFRAVFSASAFPGHTTKLEWRREESGGNWYYSDQYKMEGWLCPALFKYFATAPREIYVRAEPKS